MSKIAKIFLSHSSNDNEFVRRLAKDLKLKGVPIWFDEWELKVGDSLNEKISEGIKESGWLAVILSKQSVKSQWVKKELNAALTKELEKRHVFVLPILIEDCEIPIFLRDKVFADFRDNYKSGIEALLRRLIPEKPFFFSSKQKKEEVLVQRQPIYAKTEDSLIKIVEVKIEERNEQYPGLYNVVFILDKTPDEDWIVLFENPTRFTISIHKAKIEENEICWKASEDNIKRDKHWIYDWVEDANQRYLPVVKRKIAQQKEKYRKSQLEDNKIAELENILKGGREGTLIIPTDAVMVGLCSLRLEGCSAQNIPSPITQVNFEHQGFVHICFNCLKKQIDAGHWRAEGMETIANSNNWLAIPWEGKFLAYDGPIESLNLIEDRIYEEAISNALTNGGFHPRRCSPEKLAKHAKKGYKIIYLTDKISWRQKIVDGRQILMAKPDDS